MIAMIFDDLSLVLVLPKLSRWRMKLVKKSDGRILEVEELDFGDIFSAMWVLGG